MKNNSNNLPLAIHQTRQSAAGYVYFVRFNHYKNCYKIGSSRNVYKRMEEFRKLYGDVDLIAYGYVSDRMNIERQIQWILREHNNNSRCFSKWPVRIDYQYCGYINSGEHFIFDSSVACNVIVLFDLLCNSVQIGSSNPKFGVNPQCVSLGYGQELQKYYNIFYCRHLPYPVEFYEDSGTPKSIPVEDWDTISYCTPCDQGGL